jgi:antitoxin component YwqK of YwqJK toxin-antitoxin module
MEMERVLPDGGVERFHYRLRDEKMIKEGSFEVRDRKKRLKQRGSYASGRRSGEWTTWYPGGKRKSSVQHYRNGRLEGIHREFYPGGGLMDEFKYRDGRLDCADGYHKSWYEGGRLKFELVVRDRKLAKYAFYDTAGRKIKPPVVIRP